MPRGHHAPADDDEAIALTVEPSQTAPFLARDWARRGFGLTYYLGHGHTRPRCELQQRAGVRGGGAWGEDVGHKIGSPAMRSA